MKAVRSDTQLGEAIVRTLGLLLAFVSADFAVSMILDEDRKPQFAGLEHLAIYARPSTLSQHRVPTAGRIGASPQVEVDYAPVGAIATKGAEPRYILLEATSKYAVVQGPLGIVRLARGDALTKLGRVLSIERRTDGWAVVTEGGLISGSGTKP
jgi:hypothetical protein